MALTDYDKKNLSAADQKKIQAATDKWNAANASGDKAGMAAAAAEASAVRNNAGYKTDSSGNYTSSYSPTSGGSINYGTTDYGTIGKNQMANGASWQDVLDTYNARYNKATTTEGLSQYANDDIQNMMLQYINNQKAIEQYQDMLNSYDQENPKPTTPQSDPRIDELLNQILNREDFSYDAANDPMYQQYAEMYQREGDRAMRNTLAEAAASAGGMNTYAMTAAMQANNYYNSQLNDKIPELYQLAYEMYLKDKESQVQDLGILQNMDATQYSRYRDTINDWYNDKSFAYGAYNDAVQQGNWQTNFDYNSKWDNLTFNNDNEWKEKDWNATQSQVELENSRYDQEKAEKQLLAIIESGVMPDDNIITQAGWNKATVEQLVAAAKAEMAKKGTSSTTTRKGVVPDDVEPDDTGKSVEKTTYPLVSRSGEIQPITQTAQNFQTVSYDCDKLYKEQGVEAARAYLMQIKDTGAIDQIQFNLLWNRYKG